VGAGLRWAQKQALCPPADWEGDGGSAGAGRSSVWDMPGCGVGGRSGWREMPRPRGASSPSPSTSSPTPPQPSTPHLLPRPHPHPSVPLTHSPLPHLRSAHGASKAALSSPRPRTPPHLPTPPPPPPTLPHPRVGTSGVCTGPRAGAGRARGAKDGKSARTLGGLHMHLEQLTSVVLPRPLRERPPFRRFFGHIFRSDVCCTVLVRRRVHCSCITHEP
jgi:hypothetical protein